MKRLIGIPAIFLAGLLVGALLPFALAHEPSECPKCECPEPPPPCPDIEGDGIPDFIEAHPQHVDAEDEEAIQKALEAIERAEQAEQMEQVPQPAEIEEE
jgi:N-acetyl-beta-hexosaminidase